MLYEKLKPLALILIAGATTAAVARSAQDGAPAQPPPAATTAEAPPKPEPDPRFIKRLDDGTVLEVVAVGVDRDGPTTWWRPDGTPLAEAPCDPVEAGPHSAPTPMNVLPRKILVRIIATPGTGDVAVGLQTRSYSSRREVKRGGEVVPGLVELRAGYRKNEVAGAVEFRSADGPWKSVQDWISGMGAVGGGDHRSFVFCDAMRSGTPQTDVTLAHDVGSDETIRIVAVDEEGREHGGSAQAASAGHIRMLATTFDLPRERIKRFHVQVRPLATITIPDIALNPRPADDRP